MKNHYKNKNLLDPTNIKDACSKNYVDNLFNDPSITKNNAHIDLNEKKLLMLNLFKLINYLWLIVI